MPIRQPENAYTAGPDAVAGSSGAYFFGLQGDDLFVHPSGGRLVEYMGGSGGDRYDMGSAVGLMSVYDTGGAADSVVAQGIGFLRPTTAFVTIDQRHLFAYDTEARQGLLEVDWLVPSRRIEFHTVAEGTYDFAQFVQAVAADPRLRGDITWAQAVEAGLFELPPGAAPSDVDEALAHYKDRGIALENQTFAWTDTAGGRAGSTAATTYSGPVNHLDLQFLGAGGPEAIGGTPFNDFVNALGGDDAVSAGLGDDVLDGGTGSNFLTGGPGRDVFFTDGRGGGVTWSTITDWEAGEQLSLWGWRPGVSRATWVESGGTEGYRGATLHADLDADGAVDASVTWAGMARAQLPAPVAFDGLLWFT